MPISEYNSLLAVSHTKTGDGTHPYLVFVIPVPEGYTTTGAVIYWKSNGAVMPYQLYTTSLSAIAAFNMRDNSPMPTHYSITVDVEFRKSS